MFKPTIFEKIIHKMDLITMKFFAPYKRKKLTNKDFTIISNNCWGGVCYDHLGMKKLSPTVGSFIMPKDYLKFISHLDYYLKQDLVFIPNNSSKYYDVWKNDKDVMSIPIGRLDDIEIFFLHYKELDVARETWVRRVKRVNKDNLIFKFSYMNNCTEEDIEQFVNMKLSGKKICFVKDNVMVKNDNCLVYYKGFENSEQLYNDTYYWDKYFDITEFINSGKIVRR